MMTKQKFWKGETFIMCPDIDFRDMKLKPIVEIEIDNLDIGKGISNEPNELILESLNKK